MQTGVEQGGEMPSQTGQILRPDGLTANTNLRLTSGAIAELNSMVRNNPSLMQFTTQATRHVLGDELSNRNVGLGAEANRQDSVANSIPTTSEISAEPLLLPAGEVTMLLRMSSEQMNNHNFTDTTQVTHLTGFVYEANKYLCHACAFNTTSRLLFREHLRCHTVHKPYSCGECGENMHLKTVLYHYQQKHRHSGPSIYVKPSALVDGIMQKLGPVAPHSVSKIDVQPTTQHGFPFSSTSSFGNSRPGESGHRSDLSILDVVEDNEGMLQPLANETNQLDTLAANCDYKDGVYTCDLCKFSTRKPFEIFEHIIADVRRWKCGCTNCTNSEPRLCYIVKAAAAKLIRLEQETMGDRDFPPTEPITPIVIAPLSNHTESDQYSMAISQPAVVGGVPWQSQRAGSYNTTDMYSRPPPSYYQTLAVSTGRAFVSEDVGSPSIYLPRAPVMSTASGAYQQAPTLNWLPSVEPRTTFTTSMVSNIPVSNRGPILRIDSVPPSRANASCIRLPTQRSTHVASSSFQPTRVVHITSVPTRPPVLSEQSSPQSSSAPTRSTPLPEWLRPTLQELTMDLSQEANKQRQVETATETTVPNEAGSSSCGSGQKHTGGTGSVNILAILNSTSGNKRPGSRDNGHPIVIEVSDSSEDELPALVLPSVPEKERNEETVTEAVVVNSTEKQTETRPNRKRSSDDQSGNIRTKKTSSKQRSNARLARVKAKKTTESEKHVNDSTTIPAGSTVEDVDKGEFFRCGIPQCGHSYCDPDSLKAHTKRCHASLKIYPCPYCCCLWSDCNLLVDHILVHSGSMPYRCVQCDICFETNVELKKHFEDSHHVKVFFKCLVDGCEYESKLWTEFKVHVSCCHPAQEEYTCFACGANFTDRTIYLRHLESGMETLICCAYCPIKSKLRYSIIRHIGSVHQGLAKKVAVQTEMKCGKGGKPTWQKCSVEKPAVKAPPILRRCTHEKPAFETPPVLLRCPHCDFADVDKTLVDAHVESHKSKRDPEFAFSCTFCTFGSNNMHEYMQHLANHRGKAARQLRYFRCPYCLFTSNQMALIEKHLDKKHSKEPFKFEVQQKDVTTNGQEPCPSSGVQPDGSQGKGTSAVATQGGSNEKPQASRDPVTSGKRPKPVSTGPEMHKRLVIVLEKCTVLTTTPNTRALRSSAKRKITTDDDDKDLIRRNTKTTGVVKKMVREKPEAVQTSTRACTLEALSGTSLTDEYDVGDTEPMFTKDEDVEEEEEDSYWREMIRKSVSPMEKTTVQACPSVPRKTHLDKPPTSGVSVGECDMDEVEPVSEDEDVYWRDIIQKRNKEEVLLSDEEEDEDTYWRDIVKSSKHDKQSGGTRESCRSTPVRLSGRARAVGRKCVANRMPVDVVEVENDIPMLPQPAAPGCSSSLRIAQYQCTFCEFVCNDLRLFNEHMRSLHGDNNSLANLPKTTTGDSTPKRSRRKHTVAAAVGHAAGSAGRSTTEPDTIINPEDDKMKYHCNLCSIDCQDWETFESHMTDIHSYSVIKTDTTSPFQDIMAVPIEKRSPPVARRKFTCHVCSYSTFFKFQLRKHLSDTNNSHHQPPSSPRKKTSPRKGLRNIETRQKSDAKSSDTSQLVEPIPHRKSGEMELCRVKRARVDIDVTEDADDAGSTDDIHQVRFVKHVHTDGLYKCKKCSYANNRIDRVESHVLRSHLYLMPYKCPYCAEDSGDYNTLLRHVSDLHPKKPTCVIYRVTGAPTCRKLVRCYIVDGTTQNPLDSRATSSILMPSNTSESVDPDKRNQKGTGNDENGTTMVTDEVRGDNQGQDDNGVDELSKSLPGPESSASVMLWKCKTCSDRVSTLKEMQRHLLSQHVDLKQYKCSKCLFSADSNEIIDEHIRQNHSPDDSAVVLDMLLEKADSLRTMMVMVRREAVDASKDHEHTPDQCKCGDEFDYELLRVVGKNGNMVYDCDLCDYRASLKMRFVQHRKSHLHSTPVRCGYCDYRASSRHFLVNHISVAHPGRQMRYHLVDWNSTVTGDNLPSEGETLKDGEVMLTTRVLPLSHVETTKPYEQRDTCAHIATANDEVVDGNECSDHPVEPLLSDFDYIVTLNSECIDGLTEEKTDISTQQKGDFSMEEETEAATEEKMDGVTEEKMNDSTEEKTDAATEEKTDSLAEEKTACVTVNSSTEERTEYLAASSTEGKADGFAKEITGVSTEEKLNGSVEEKTDDATEEKTYGATDEKTDVAMEEETEAATKEKTDGATGEKTDVAMEEKVDGLTEEKTDGATVNCSTEERTEYLAACSTEGKTDSFGEEITDDSMEKKLNGATDEKTDNATEEKMYGATDEKTDDATEEKTDSVTDEKMDGATDEKTDDATEEKTDGATEEKTDGATKEKTEGTTDKRTDGVTGEKTDCATEEKADDATEEKTDESIDSQQAFMCVTCSTTMLLEQDIQHHVMVEHLEQKPYVCMYCDHSSANKRSVQLHTEKIHAGKPLCIIYETNGQLEARIKENIVSVSSDTASQLPKPLVCNLCNKYTTRSMFQFLDHIAKEIKYTPYQCLYCSYSSIWRNAVKIHVASKHPQAQIRILLSEDVAQNRKILELVKQSDIPHDSDETSDFNIFGDQAD